MDKLACFFILTLQCIGRIAVQGQVVNLVGIGDGGAVLGDYDNDGDLDVLIAGSTQTACCVGPPIARIYRNDGNGVFTDIGAPLIPVYRAEVAWVDYDNDGNLDCFLTGLTENNFWGTRLYRNNGHDTFTEVQVDLEGGYYGNVEWGDFDNDGDLDLLYSGPTRLFRNDGNDVFTAVSIGLPSESFSTVRWMDYDMDGVLDILYAGGAARAIYRNQGGQFVQSVNFGPSDLRSGYVDVGDVNNDGHLDICLMGLEGFGTPFSGVYVSDGSGGINGQVSRLPGFYDASVAFGDYDGDGDLDILASGYSSFAPTIQNTEIFTDSLGYFDNIATLGGSSKVAWGDIDGDGRLDFILVGLPTTRIYFNSETGVNPPPDAPANLRSEVLGTGVRLSWNSATDSNQLGGLTYNFRVGTRPGKSDVVPCMADPVSGRRRIPALGNAQTRQFAWLTNLVGGTYYWSVQAIDHGYAGSPFAPENSFIIETPPFLRAVRRTDLGELVLSIRGMVGKTYAIEKSSDLKNWQHSIQITGTGEDVLVTVPRSGDGTALFIRASR
jgi:hypothetical protein